MPHAATTTAEVNAIIASRIKQLREEMGISQRQLCRLAGLSNSTLIPIENHSGGITAANLLAIAQALDTTPDWFYGDLLK